MKITQIKQEFVSQVKLGGIFVYPTETVYGIGCVIENKEQVAKIKQIKSRPDEQGLIILSGSWQEIEFLVKGNISQFSASIEAHANDCATFVFKASEGAPRWLVDARSSHDTVAVRITKSKLLQEILLETGPLVSTSANISGEKSPKSFSEISVSILEQVDFAYKKDSLLSGKESRIIDVYTNKIIRQ